MLKVLLGLLLVTNTVSCQNPDICDAGHAETRKKMCEALALNSNEECKAGDCGDAQGTDGNSLKVFLCSITSATGNNLMMTDSYLNAGEIQGNKIVKIHVFTCSNNCKEKFLCESEKFIDCDIPL